MAAAVLRCLAAVLSVALRFSVFASCLASVLSASPVRAQGPEAFVVRHWQAPAKAAKLCRDPSHFVALTTERIGASGVRQSSLLVDIQIDRADSRWRLKMTTKGSEGEGERELFANNCRTLLQTAAVVLSLALLPDYFQNERDNVVVTTLRPASASSGVQGQATDSEVPLTPERVVRAASERKGLGHEPLDVGVRAAALANLGTLPQPAIGLALVVHAEAASYQLAFRLSRWAEQRKFVVAFDPGRGGRFDYLAGTLQLCKTIWNGAGGCAQATLGRLSAEAIEIVEPISQANLIPSAGGAVFFESRMATWARFRVQAELGAHILRPRYFVEVQPLSGELETLVEREIHQTSLIYAGLSAGWGLAF